MGLWPWALDHLSNVVVAVGGELISDGAVSTSPNGHEHSVLSDKPCNKSNHLVDISYIPENEISLTEQWPHSGEELPVISPGDNIEKSVHVNSDGTMTVEMKVRFKIKEEETINWSTTVSRSNISYYKTTLSTSIVDPEDHAVIANNYITNGIEDGKLDEHADSIVNTYEVCAEEEQHDAQDAPININTYGAYSAREEKTHFYRPPTPGIRRVQGRKTFTKSQRRVSEGNTKENISQVFCREETGNADIYSVNNDVNHYNKQTLITDKYNCQQSGDKREHTVTASDSRDCFSTKVRQGSTEVLETRSMKLLQSNLTGKTLMRKSDITTGRSDYVCFTGVTQQERPHSAGKNMFHHDQFNFKEIKRSVSASVTYTEPSTLKKQQSHDFVANNQVSLDAVSPGNIIALMRSDPCMRSSGEAQIAEDCALDISGGQMKCNLENDTNIKKDILSIFPEGQKKKKKKKYESDQIKQKQCQQREIPRLLKGETFDSECIKSNVHIDAQRDDITDNADSISGSEKNHATDTIIFKEKCVPHVSTSAQLPELSTVRKLKGNKQMAKVKPRSVKKNNEAVASQNHEDGLGEKIEGTEQHLSAGSLLTSSSDLHNSDLISYSLTENNVQQEEEVAKRPSKQSKKSKKSANRKLQNKKTKNSKLSENKTVSGTDGLDAAIVYNSVITHNSLESYVQNWLKNIFPNASLPVIHLLSSTRKEDAPYFIQSQVVKTNEETKRLDESEGYNANSKQNCDREESNQLKPTHTESSVGQEMLIQPASFLIEKSDNLAELFFEQIAASEDNVFLQGSKSEELTKLMSNSQMINTTQKKPSADVAVQVECETNTKSTTDYRENSNIGDVLMQELKSYTRNTQKAKCRHLEKSFSVPDLVSEEATSSSQLLLAWLIVFHLKESMKHIIGDMSQNVGSGSTMFSLLQSLKKIAITEKADDLKSAVLSLQESALRLDSGMQNSTSLYEKIAAAETQSSIQLLEEGNITMENNPNDETTNANDIMNDEETVDEQEMSQLSGNSDLMLNESETHVFTDDIDDLCFFEAMPDNEFSSDMLAANIVHLDEGNGSRLELHESENNSTTSLQGDTERLHAEDHKTTGIECSEEIHVNESQRDSISPMSNANIEKNAVSTKKISKVKMMVQEMEQRKYFSHCCENQKCLQSPISSDWSDYRQDSEESLISDTLKESSEIMTESGEEQVQEKPFKRGFVKRTIERLYGKTESKVLPANSSNKGSPNKGISKELEGDSKVEVYHSRVCKQAHKWWSKENILRSLSSPGNRSKNKKQENCASSIKSTSLPLLEGINSGVILQGSESIPSNGLEMQFQNNNDDSIKSDPETNGGVLIDKGRWLLKENHLVRRSPPEATGMYGLLDTTSADTFLDTTSDDIPYHHSICKVNQQLPLGDVSSSEIEDMVKPHNNTCNYFNMPHGSDSEPFHDTFNAKTQVQSKSLGGIVKNKIHDSVSLASFTSTAQKDRGITGSLPSFTSVDLHYPDNKVHPLQQPKEDKTNESQTSNSSATNREQIQEQDSLDKLQYVCGQHCPILTAIIEPINEESRGFVYRRPYDIEKLLFLHSVSKNEVYVPLSDMKVLTDENNNISIHYIDSTIVSINVHDDYDASYSLSLSYRVWGDIEMSENGHNGKRYLLSRCPMPTVSMASDNSNTLYSDMQTYSISQEVVCITNDENNNILYQ
ncbi:oxygen-regulated protein 1-like [Rhinophrynus dorsalis]